MKLQLTHGMETFRDVESPHFLLLSLPFLLLASSDALLGDLRKYLAARLVSLSALCKPDVGARSIELVEHICISVRSRFIGFAARSIFL